MDDEDRYTRITLRIPKELHGSLSEAASNTSKSLNAEIVGRLERSFSSSEEASAEVLMLEMRRTQLLLRRAQVDSDASHAFFGGGDAAKKELAYRQANPDPVEIEEAKKSVKRAKLKASHHRNEVAEIDGRLQEIERRLQELGYSVEYVTAEDPTDHPIRVLKKPNP